MKLQLSNAPCSWGVEFADNPSNPSWETVLQEISLAGYKATELGPLGYLPTDTGVLAAKLDEHGLGLIAGTIFKHLHKAEKRAEILEYTEATCKLLKAQNAQYMVVIDHVSSPRTDQAGQVQTAYRLPDEEWFEMMKTITELSLMCREYDIVPVIHPHAGTFIEYRDEIDRAMQDLDSDLVKLCVDTGHCKYAGINPAELIEAYQDRVAYIHFKDINEVVLAHTVENHVDFYKAIGNGVFCPLGQGCVDFSAVRNTLEKINYTGWITVEQDVDPTKDNSSLENAQESLRFINQHFIN